MANRARVERILVAVFTRENRMQGTATPFLVDLAPMSLISTLGTHVSS